METETRPFAKSMLPLSSQEMLNLGLTQVAYIRPFTEQDETAFAIHAADGNRLAVLPSRDLAEAVLRQNELQPVSLH